MRSRLLWRRVATAASIYGSVALGFAGTLVAARALGQGGFGELTTVLAVAGFCQILLDLTVEEALVKYGFRYVTSERYGALRTLYRGAVAVKGVGALLAAAALAALAPFGDDLFGRAGLLAPLLLAALLPP